MGRLAEDITALVADSTKLGDAKTEANNLMNANTVGINFLEKSTGKSLDVEAFENSIRGIPISSDLQKAINNYKADKI